MYPLDTSSMLRESASYCKRLLALSRSWCCDSSRNVNGWPGDSSSMSVGLVTTMSVARRTRSRTRCRFRTRVWLVWVVLAVVAIGGVLETRVSVFSVAAERGLERPAGPSGRARAAPAQQRSARALILRRQHNSYPPRQKRAAPRGIAAAQAQCESGPTAARGRVPLRPAAGHRHRTGRFKRTAGPSGNAVKRDKITVTSQTN